MAPAKSTKATKKEKAAELKAPPVWTPEAGNVALGRLYEKGVLYPCIVCSFTDTSANVQWIELRRTDKQTSRLPRARNNGSQQLFVFEMRPNGTADYKEAQRIQSETRINRNASKKPLSTNKLLNSFNPAVRWSVAADAKSEVDSAMHHLSRVPTRVQTETFEDYFLHWAQTPEAMEEFERRLVGSEVKG